MDAQLRYPGHIILDDLGSWPVDAREVLEARIEDITCYLREECRIDKAAETNVLLRIDRPDNRFEEAWKSTLKELHGCLEGLSIIGFHCTRLTEAEDIELNGLRPLTRRFAEERITRLESQHRLSSPVAEALMNSNNTEDLNRAGRVCFFHCLSTLKVEVGVVRLFKSWGGESIYRQHETAPIAMDELRRVGSPCIVVGSLKLSEVNNFVSIEERIIRSWLDSEEKGLADCDSHIFRTVTALEIIQRDDTRFEQLTGCSKWSYPI